MRAPDEVAAFAILLLPIAAIASASVFVYRHTARRRALQATLTAVVSSTLTLAAILIGSLFSPERSEERQSLKPVVNDSFEK